MGETDEVELARRRRAIEVVRLAISAAGDIDEGFSDRVLAAAPRIAALLQSSADHPGAVEAASWVLDASVFKAKFERYELEDKSQRLMVYVHSDKAEDAEPLRTEPLWSPLGRMMARRVKALRRGDQLVVYKYMDQFKSTDGAGRPMMKNSRVLANFEIERRAAQEPSAPTGGAANPAAVSSDPHGTGAGVGDPPPGSPAPTSLDNMLGPDDGVRVPTGASDVDALARRMTAVEQSMKGLDNRQKIAVKVFCNAQGIKAFASPQDDDTLDKVLVIINKVARGELP